MQIKIEHTFLPEHETLYEDVFDLTQSLSQNYPNYSRWYHQTFLEGLKKGNRAMIMAEEKGKLVGVALIKNTPEEKKLCTLFVCPENRRQGIGQRLLAKTINELGQNPLVSVSEKNKEDVLPLFNRFGFRLSAQKKDAYQIGKVEYYFNDEKAESIQKGLIPVLIQRVQKLRHTKSLMV